MIIGAKLPFQAQYPISPVAAEGIRGTIEGLLQAGSLKKVPFAECNTPIYPVLKADKVRWRMVQDLRRVNAIVEDWPAEVPNPHTLWTNIPTDAKVFSVLFSSFHSFQFHWQSRAGSCLHFNIWVRHSGTPECHRDLSIIHVCLIRCFEMI